jgi:hypothetical protein
MKLDGLLSLLIACIEIVFIINLLIFAAKNNVNKLVILLIILLFEYQFIEFLICFAGLQKQIFIYLALLSISLLPPLSLFTALTFDKKESFYNLLIFIPALFFIVYYPFVIDRFAVTKCTVLYASYHYPLGDLYGIIYYLPVIATMILLYRKWKAEDNIKQKSLTRVFLFGYLFTFLPAIIFVLAFPSLIKSVESLLCKFAFVLAAFLTYFALNNKMNKV